MGHEWITVLNRRWCLGCDAFQSRRDAGPMTQWKPSVAAECQRYTPFAKNQDALSMEADK
jgi:hypothetical protein